MKMINDAKIYMITGIVTLTVSILLFLPSCYSLFFVEPEIKAFLNAKENISENYKKAYLLLRKPFIFGKYQHFDAEGITVKNSITYFDRWIYEGQELNESHKQYLEVIMHRREKGSHLGRYSGAFFICISLLSWIFFFLEKSRIKRKAV